MDKRRFSQRLRAVFIIYVISMSVHASDRFRVSGFGNVSLIKSGTETLGFNYDLSKKGIYDQWNLKTGSVFGLQLNTEVNDSIDFVLQGVFQDRVNNDLNKTVTWAFLRYYASPHVSFRAGRIATPIYMLSEYRNVNFAYLWTKPITDFYSTIPITHIDGGDMVFRVPLGSGFFESQFFMGRSEISVETIFKTYEVTLSPLMGSKLTYTLDDWLFSAVAATTKVHKGEPADTLISYLTSSPAMAFLWPSSTQIATDFSLVDSRISYFSLGTFFETGDWNIQSELSYTNTDWPFFPDLTAGYFSLGRMYNDTTFYGFASKAKSIGDFYSLSAPPSSSLAIPDIAMAYNLINSNLQARVIDQETLGLGVRIDIHSNVALKGQIERTWLKDNHIGGWLVSANGLQAAVPDHIDTFSISVSFVF